MSEVVRVFCDACGSPIEKFSDRWTLTLNANAMHTRDFKHDFHAACGEAVVKHLEAFTARPLDGDAS